jgi:hypothetical protein
VEAFALMSADPLEMEFLRRPVDREESDSFVDRIEAGFAGTTRGRSSSGSRMSRTDLRPA